MSRVTRLTPFQPVTIACPICEHEQQHHKIKATLYTEKNRDIDLRPRRVDWNPKVSPKVDPKLYYFWHCKHCNFCADYVFYQSPFKEGNMSPMRFRKHLAKSLDRDPNFPAVLAVLDPSSESEKSDFMRTIRRNLLAIYELEAVEEVRDRECLQIGAYYLRLAWLIRDIKSSKMKADRYKIPTRNLLGKIRKVWPKVALTERDMLMQAVKYYHIGLNKSQVVSTTPMEIQINLIIARIQLQMGALDEGQKALIVAKKKATQFASIAQKKEKEGRLSADDIDRMTTAASKSVSLVRNVETIFEKLRDAKLERKLNEAMDLLKESTETDLEARREILRSKGFEEKVVLKACPPIKKKGLLEFLKSG
ncbi:DUF2225 domain-containing protein [Pseudobacteriovorax antillogorgiicola]|uniref:DUF2225 domain-containing protein n=1 Tax=Pseudobacteriovorax antillogorgiicola TaxID=1513793 RepID=A0A1Y6C3C8_9BACT|nr:DUF2225 domain-containing protein [Pseudobacteriovorax antillogorgiicola]TCS50649.1 uncharacterized protein DUF2225 [Pseudobacteriovorax antillogorgiicola]SMF39687.1 hypothetical protein SAMN06296036_11230 [Pseudobacteriovorax antillogorgiicola]